MDAEVAFGQDFAISAEALAIDVQSGPGNQYAFGVGNGLSLCGRMANRLRVENIQCVAGRN